MLDKKPRKPRKDIGTRRNDRPDDRTFAFRLNPDKPSENEIIKAIDDHLRMNPKSSLREIIVTCIGERLGKHPLTREAELVDTLEQQIERLASSIDRLLTLKLERVSDNSPLQTEPTDEVDMNYLKRIQQTLRGGKK